MKVCAKQETLEKIETITSRKDAEIAAVQKESFEREHAAAPHQLEMEAMQRYSGSQQQLALEKESMRVESKHLGVASLPLRALCGVPSAMPHLRRPCLL